MSEETIGNLRPNPLWRPLSILLAALTLSIGWGIRGNYGHETGAMFPGALTAIAVCLLSGREDWRERVAYFACFGALGWAFGGSISYMQVITYTQSGHAATQYYGYWGLFLIGFLWAALGGAGTALPAVLDRKGLNDLFRPLSLLLALWTVLYFVEDPLARKIQEQFGARFGSIHTAQRHESLLYWMDSDWLSVFVILVGILAFDLIDRRFSNSLWLPAFAVAGGIVGHLIEMGLVRSGWSAELKDLLVHPLGDTAKFDKGRLITNWPELFHRGGDYLGLAAGVALGVGVYFAIFGKFRRGSSLFLHMALGWFAGFLLFPVLLDIRMTPPRGDNWAGILGVVAGVLLYSFRHKLWPLIVATLVTGTIGGIGFSGIAWLEALLESLGNPNLAPNLAAAWTEWQSKSVTDLTYPPSFLAGVQTPLKWKFWHEANWHSFLEQSYGFVNGIGVIVAMALLVRRMGPLKNEAKRQYWTEILAVTVALPVLLYVNLVKNVADWTAPMGRNLPSAIPLSMGAPLIGFPLSSWAWFNILFGVAAIALVLLLSIHTRRRLAILEQSWLGRGQLFYLTLLWAFVIGNFGKALPGFDERRLLTEGVITLNAVLATMMLLLLPRSAPEATPTADSDFGRLIAGSVAALVICAALVPPLEAASVRAVYGDAPGRRMSKDGPQMRFGPRAYWKFRPLLKGVDHR